MPESPRFAYRQGDKDGARKTLAKLNGLETHSALIDAEIAQIEEQLEAERQGDAVKWTDIFTRRTMLYRTVLGMVLQAGQQLTGANFFFYYSTTIFKSTGLSNSYVTSIILGTVNVVATIFGLWLVKVCGRRKALIGGALWMFACFMVYTFVGTYALDENRQAAGSVLIVFTCLFIVAFATTWGPLVWAIVGELYPARYRAPCMALATASNWLFNFLISFFTTFITNKIHYWYGLVFGVSCLVLAFIVYLFLIESKDRSLEEIHVMYLAGVNPITSATWDPSELGPDGIKGLLTDNYTLADGGQAIKKQETVGTGMMQHDERRFPDNPRELATV
jgi:SP family sugar:H+ symporter-like MFS transporter